MINIDIMEKVGTKYRKRKGELVIIVSLVFFSIYFHLYNINIQN